MKKEWIKISLLIITGAVIILAPIFLFVAFPEIKSINPSCRQSL